MRIVTLLVIVACPLAAQLLPQVAPEQVGLSKERIARIKPVQEKYVADGQLAGGVMIIARKGQVAYFDTFGKMDKDGTKPMPKDAIFRLYSMTKPIITVAALTLYEEGKFSMLDPVSKFIPEFAKMSVMTKNGLVPAERPITILDLMRHTWGQNNQGPRDPNGVLVFSRSDARHQTLEEGIKTMAAAPGSGAKAPLPRPARAPARNRLRL